MIYLLSDEHGGEKVGDLKKYIQNNNDNNLLIILGDVGLKFADTKENKEFDEFLLSSKNKIAIIDGNHENFKYLYSFPEENWGGGVIHRITDNIIHLERGYVYEIDGKTFFVFGGCKSSKKWKEQGLWQIEEAPTEEEILRAYENLKKYNYKVDYILMHKYEKGEGEPTKELLDLCSFIDKNVDFKHFYAGHWHYAKAIDSKHTIVYDKLVEIK